MSRAALIGLLLAALLCGPAAAQDPTPDEPRLIATVAAGYDGGAPRNHPAPVWITLVNPGERLAGLTLVAVSGDARSQIELELPAGGRRRVCLAIRILRDDVLVQLERDGEVLERRRIKELKRLDVKRHLLSIDGRPAEKRTAAGSRRGDPSLYVTAIEASDAPTEAACYEAFGAVLLRGVDPDGWDRDQIGAVLEYAAQGGTLILDQVQPGRAEQVGLLRRLHAKPEPAKLLGQAAQSFVYGQGRVLAFKGDVLLGAYQAGAKAAQAKQDLGDLIEGGRGQVKFAPTFQTYQGSFPDHPASSSQALVGGFLLVYLIAIGPVLAFALRKSSRKKLALTALIGVAAFSLLAFAVAGIVRVGAGVAFVNEVVYVPKQGPAMHLSDITIVSGGASRYRIELGGPESLAATVLPASTDQYVSRWRRDDNRFRGTRTARGSEVQLDLEMPLWGQQSVETLAVVPDVKPLVAELRRSGGAYRVRVVNTTGKPIEQALVMELTANVNKFTGYAEVGRLEPGQEKVVTVVRNARLRVPRDQVDDLCWAAKLNVPETWRAWTQVAPRRTSGRAAALSFAVISSIAPRLTARGRNLRPVEHALRIDPVTVDPTLERGYLGVVLEEGNRGTVNGRPWVETRILRVYPNSPAARAGLTAGQIIVTFENDQLRSPQDLRDRIGRHLPGERVRLGVNDPTRGRFRNMRVRLGARAEVPRGD